MVRLAGQRPGLLAAFSAAVVLGVAARLGPRLAASELHRALALFSVAFLGLHVVTAILDPYVTIGWAATLLPLASRTGRSLSSAGLADLGARPGAGPTGMLPLPPCGRR